MPSALVEYLVNQNKSTSEPLCFHSGSATWVPAFPGNTSTTFYLSPGAGEYAYLLYKVLWDTANLPQAFSIYAQHAGVRPFDGIVHQIFGDVGIEGWLTITEAQKLLVRVTNRSNLIQRLSYGFEWLTVKTREDWDLLAERIERYSTALPGDLSGIGDLLRAIRQPQAVFEVPAPPRVR